MTTDAFSEPVAFPEPTMAASSRREVFLRYLDYFRSRLVDKLTGLPASELSHSRLPSGWTPVELIKHLQHVEIGSPTERRRMGTALLQTAPLSSRAPRRTERS